MKIFVCLKQVPDTKATILSSEEGKSIEESGLDWIINPYDEFALEEALRIKETNLKEESELISISLGPKRVEKVLRLSLAMGADRSIWIESEKSLNPMKTAEALYLAIKDERPDIILMGKTGIDENHSATGAMLAQMLNLAHVGFVTKLQKKQNNIWLCERTNDLKEKILTENTPEDLDSEDLISKEVLEQITLCLPFLITVEKGINTPRYPSLPGIMKAKKKEVKKISLNSLDSLDTKTKKPFVFYELPKPLPPSQMITGTAEQQAQKLVALLKEKEKLI